LRLLLVRPVERAEQHAGIAAFRPDYLADHSPRNTGGDPDSNAADVSSKGDPGAVRAVTVAVPVSRLREILLDDLQTAKGRMLGVNSAVEHRHGRAGAGKRRAIRPDGGDAPRLARARA
jgi:hypothetical protein